MPEENKDTAEDTSASEEQDTSSKDEKEGILTQGQFDKALQERLKREKEANEKHLKDTLSKEREEWEKQSKMSQDEREKELLKRKEEETQEKDRELTLRENKLDAISQLEEEGIPQASKVAPFLLELEITQQEENVANFIGMVKELVIEMKDKDLRGTTPRDVNPTKGEPRGEVPYQL